MSAAPSPTPDDAVSDFQAQWFEVCSSADLVNGGLAQAFEVMHQGHSCSAFAVRYQGQVRAYLNRCTHVAMEMDWMPNRFFSADGQWLLCATHGATHNPLTGACAGGPCNGGLTAIHLHERDGLVYWQSQYDLLPVAF